MTPQARALLRDARPDFSPSPAEADRLRARVFGGLPPDDPSGGGGAAGAGGAASSIALVAALVVGVLVVWALPSDETAPAGDERVGASAESPIDADASPPPAAEPAPVGDAASPSSALAEAPLEDPAVDDPPAALAERTPAPPSIPAHPAPSEPAVPSVALAPATDDLAAELELIGAARRALNAEAWGEVRSLAREHLDRFPEGVLREEAYVLDLLARCATEPSPALEATVRDYVAKPGHVFDARLRRACL